MKIEQALLSKNIFSSPGKKLSNVKGIVIHWVANAGSSATANRNYFESLARQSPGNEAARYASAHFIVGINGEIVQCIPVDEMAYHVGAKSYKPEAVSAFGHYPNNCTIGIEFCHPDASGKFTDDTLYSACRLSAALCVNFHLSPMKDIWTHNQITGKNCPKWFVERPDDFLVFKQEARKFYRVEDPSEAGGWSWK
jgi:N-acetylmuramoyl-L-alanine amidase